MDLISIKDIQMDRQKDKMTERISAGIYFITNFFDDKEPLKWKLRTLATDFLSDSLRDVKELSSLISLAKRVGFLSDTNYEILALELTKLDEHKSIGLIIGRDELPMYKRIAEPMTIKDKIPSVKKNTRQEAILSIVKSKKEVGITDISSVVKGHSTKTIQRELLYMVVSGVLKKSGEKRWSRYSIA